MPAEQSGVRPAAVYRVAVRVDQEIAEEWLEWMRTIHVPAVLDTGCFTGCVISRQVDPSEEGPRWGFVLEYGLPSLEHFERYQARHADALRDAHTGRYAGRFEASRSIALVVDHLWPAPG